jgi:CO/xanthine dehydrogenase Mo-binding subunit
MNPVSRRNFLVASTAAGTGLVIGFYLPRSLSAADQPGPFSPNAYLRIAPDGIITIVVARSEMGQGIRTSLPMILAEELEADWSQISIEQAGASTLFGDQTTGGSASVRTTWDPMRKAGAAAREMLIAAAAQEWGVEPAACKAENCSIFHAASNRRRSYADLVAKAATLPVPADPPLKSPKDYKIVGQRLARIDTPSKVDGSATYGIDFRIPGVKFAFLSRSPVIGGKVVSVDDRRSREILGVTDVVKVGDSAVAVVATSVWEALQGRRALQVKWDNGGNGGLNSTSISESLKKSANGKPVTLYESGDVGKAQGKQVTAEFELPFLAHAPMEPGNTTAFVQEGSCEIWSPTQVPQDVRDSVASAIGLKPEQVKVNVTLLGGGFGRRLEHDYAVEAALVSQGIKGPVKVLWTREDDMQFSTYRPVSFHQLQATVDELGWPLAFSHRIISPSISRQKGQPGDGGIDPDLKDEAAILYPIPNVKLEYVDLDTPVPLGWMRSVYASQMAFASESFLNELAATAKKDPLEYRLHLLSKDQEIKYFDTTWQTARLREVLHLAAEKSEWAKPLPAGHYRGIAAFACFNSYVAEVVEISMKALRPQVHRVVVAADCGQQINPNILEQQAESAVIFAMTAALYGNVKVENGRIAQSNFSDYPLVRMPEAPKVEAYFVKSSEAPTGIGEPPVPPFAPALCAAIHAATGKRIRSLPIVPA